MKRFRLLVSVGCVFAAAVTWWMWSAVSDALWEISEPVDALMEWKQGEPVHELA